MSDMRLSCRDATNRGPDYEREAVAIYGHGWLHHDKTDAYRTSRRVSVLTCHLLPSVISMQSIVASQIPGELRRRFGAASRVLVLTGAGVSAESGVPTFRGGGDSTVWNALPFDVISSRTMLESNLPAVWEWFDYRRSALEALSPNAAHYCIAGWQNRFPQFTLVTQNVDGLHGMAGSRDVIELHGSVWRARCISCAARFEILRESRRPDACFDCGDRLRPDVV